MRAAALASGRTLSSWLRECALAALGSPLPASAGGPRMDAASKAERRAFRNSLVAAVRQWLRDRRDAGDAPEYVRAADVARELDIGLGQAGQIIQLAAPGVSPVQRKGYSTRLIFAGLD